MKSRSNEIVPAPALDLCLAFANTRYWRGTAAPTDELGGVEDLRAWAVRSGHLPAVLAKRFAAPGVLLGEAIGLRELIYRCFAASASGGSPEETDMATLNSWLIEAPGRRRVATGGWLLGEFEPSAAALLAPVLWSAADLLAGGQLRYVRQCANPECCWLFLDNSKSGNRRWCSMSACGNRAKAHRHYLRQKTQ